MTGRTLYVPGTEETDLKKVIMSLQQVAGVVSQGIGGRETLTVNRTYYVRTDGSDSNDGLNNTAAGAFLTVQKAINVCLTLDMSGNSITIQLAAGTYSGQISLSSPFIGGLVFIVGDNTTPTNVVLSTTNNLIAVANQGSVLGVSGVKVSSTNGSCLIASNGGVINVTNSVNFGACGAFGAHMQASTGGSIVIFGVSYAISGGGGYHMAAQALGSIVANLNTVTVAGGLTFSYFASANFNGYLEAQVDTYSAGVTGQRYLADHGGGIYTAGGGANYFPGSVAGSATSPGWYA